MQYFPAIKFVCEASLTHSVYTIHEKVQMTHVTDYGAQFPVNMFQHISIALDLFERETIDSHRICISLQLNIVTTYFLWSYSKYIYYRRMLYIFKFRILLNIDLRMLFGPRSFLFFNSLTFYIVRFIHSFPYLIILLYVCTYQYSEWKTNINKPWYLLWTLLHFLILNVMHDITNIDDFSNVFHTSTSFGSLSKILRTGPSQTRAIPPYCWAIWLIILKFSIWTKLNKNGEIRIRISFSRCFEFFINEITCWSLIHE